MTTINMLVEAINSHKIIFVIFSSFISISQIVHLNIMNSILKFNKIQTIDLCLEGNFYNASIGAILH